MGNKDVELTHSEGKVKEREKEDVEKKSMCNHLDWVEVEETRKR